MKLWGKLFHFGGNANSSVRQETHCQHVVPLGDGGTAYFGLYGSIRRRRSSRLPYTASSKSASASPCCQRAPSTIELLQDQQKRLATIAATPRMARALQKQTPMAKDLIFFRNIFLSKLSLVAAHQTLHGSIKETFKFRVTVII
ncbi:hypothetical protein TTRE_0000288501 [Trichuris trichiura]|uniref:Uncharacterized protein n=1 Tax=Trichuris trichiura TaxID=36087 RepID=A0A077Z7G5_TRITR|nr:hypothetical protein TTRE_0000288501 [Trichuris trichiura]